MAGCSEALFTSMAAIIAADTGTGGAANTASDAYIQRFVQEDDPNYSPERSAYWNHLVLDVFENSRTSWGVGQSATDDKVEYIARLTLRTLRDGGRTKQNAAETRLRYLFDGSTPASQTGWNFSPMSLTRVQQGPAAARVYAITLEFSGRAKAAAASGNAELVGRQASVTFAGTEGSGIGSTLVGYVASSDVRIKTQNVTRWFDVADRFTLEAIGGQVSVDFAMTSMTPVVPVGTPAALVMFVDTANTKKMTFTNAILVGVSHNAPEGGNPQTVRMTFAVTSTGGSNTVANTNPIVAA